MSMLTAELLDLQVRGQRLGGVSTLGELIAEPIFLAFLRHGG